MTFLILWNCPGGGGGSAEETLAGDTPGRECPHDDMEIRPLIGTMRTSDDRVPSMNIESPYEGGMPSLPGDTGSLLPGKFPAAPALLADGTLLGSWQVGVVRVDETPAGDASGLKCPHTVQNRQQSIDEFEVVLAGGSPMTDVVYPAGPDGPVGPCETSSLSFEGIQEPLEHTVPSYADPAGQHGAVGTLSPSDCYPAGPIGPCETSSLSFEELQELLEYLVLIYADPAGQHAAVGTLSPSDCYPVGPDDSLQVLKPFEQLVLEHADPAGKHAVIQDTVDSLEHSRMLPDATLDGRLMEGTTYLEHSALGSELMEGMLNSEPVEQSVLNTLWVARPTGGITEETSD